MSGAAYMRVYRLKNRRLLTERNNASSLKKRELILSLLGDKCVKCGFSDKRALQVDHINGGGREDRKTVGLSREALLRDVVKSLNNGGSKYQLLCANCNWIKRFENQEHTKRYADV